MKASVFQHVVLYLARGDGTVAQATAQAVTDANGTPIGYLLPTGMHAYLRTLSGALQARQVIGRQQIDGAVALPASMLVQAIDDASGELRATDLVGIKLRDGAIALPSISYGLLRSAEGSFNPTPPALTALFKPSFPGDPAVYESAAQIMAPLDELVVTSDAAANTAATIAVPAPPADGGRIVITQVSASLAVGSTGTLPVKFRLRIGTGPNWDATPWTGALSNPARGFAMMQRVLNYKLAPAKGCTLSFDAASGAETVQTVSISYRVVNA